MYKIIHFDLQELVCAHVYYRFGEMARQFLYEPQMIMMDWIRDRLGPVYVNNYQLPQYANSDYIKYISKQLTAKPPLPIKLPKIITKPDGLLDQRGMRCNQCQITLDKTNAGMVYASGHGLARADDFDVKGMSAEEVRQYLIKHKDELPFPIRLEKDKSWVHMDTEEDLSGEKVHLFDA
jgi:hypothetical protein